MAGSSSGVAATFTWNGGGTDDNWSTAANWSGNAVAASATDTALRFGGATRLTPTATSAFSLNSITFEAGAGAFTLGGSALTLTAGGSVTNNSSSLQTLANSGVTLSGASTWNSGAAGLSVSSVLSGSGSLTKTGTGVLTLSGANTYGGATTINAGTLRLGTNAALASAGTVTVAGTGANGSATWDLNGYDQTVGTLNFGSSGGGANAINTVTTGAGTLTLGGNVAYTNPSSSSNHAGTAILSGNLSLGGATRTFTIGDSGKTTKELSVSAIVGGTGGLTKAGGGVLELANAANTYTGATTVTAGTLVVTTLANGGVNSSLGASTNAASNLVLAGGTLRYSGAATQTDRLIQIGTATSGGNAIGYLDSSGTGAIRFTNTGAIAYGQTNQTRNLILTGTNTGDNTFAASIGNNGTGVVRVDKEGVGKWVLSGANTYTGITYVYAGTLSAAHDSALGTSAGGVTVGTGATLNLDNVNIAESEIKVTGTGVGGQGALTWTGTSSYSGKLNFNNGNTTIGGTGTLTVNALDMLYTSTVVTKTGGGTLVIGGTGYVNGMKFVINEGAVILNKTGTHAMAGDYVTVNNGASLQLAGTGGNQIDNYTSVIVNTGGLFDTNGRNEAFASLEGGGTVTNSAAGTTSTLTIGGPDWNPDTTFSGVVQDGAGKIALYKSGSGTLTLSGANTFTGNIINASGTVLVTGSLGAGNYAGRIANYATLRFNSASDQTLVGDISASGALMKSGAGTLTLSAQNTYTGATTINGGTLRVNGSLANTVVTVASGATLTGSGTIGGPTTITSGAHLAPGNSPGTITFTGGLTLEGGSILDFELGETSDLIRVTGGVLSGPSSGTILVNLTDASGFIDGTYTLIDATGATFDSFDTSFFELGTHLEGYTYTFVQNGALFQLAVTAVPEPAAFTLLAGAAVLGGCLLRRPRRASA